MQRIVLGLHSVYVGSEQLAWSGRDWRMPVWLWVGLATMSGALEGSLRAFRRFSASAVSGVRSLF